jgi:hypothetical protein
MQPQLLALYLALLSRLLKFQGDSYKLEMQTATCLTILLLEGFQGLAEFGNNIAFQVRSSDSTRVTPCYLKVRPDT